MVNKKGEYYQDRNKFFYAMPAYYPDWDIEKYPSRYAIGVKLDDAWYRDNKQFVFKIKNKFYRIPHDLAVELGNKYTFAGGSLPNLIPKEAFTEEDCEPNNPQD